MTATQPKPETTTTNSGEQSKMTLLNMTDFPPHGWVYREVALNWWNPDPLHGEGLHHAVRLLQTVRAQNPTANLDPSYAACKEAIMAFTCARLKYDPKWCGLQPKEAQIQASRSIAQVGRRCAGCGRR